MNKYFLLIVCIFFISIVQAQENTMMNATIQKKDLEIVKFFPKEVKLGDVQFNIQIKNNLNRSLENVHAFITGRGFSTYEVLGIESLGPYEKDYIFVDGNLRESGEINLTIRIDKDIFYQIISVIDVVKESNVSDEELQKQRLQALEQELESLKKNYTALELLLSEKKDLGYDVSGIDLEDLKKNLRAAESDIFSQRIADAEVSLRLAYEEYAYQKGKIDSAKIIPVITRLKENALVVSAILGAILAFFALTELLRRMSESTYRRVKTLAKKRVKR